MTHLRLIVNVVVGIMLGSLFINAGNEGSRVLENYNLLFAILMHHMMSPMMLTILTCKYSLYRLHFNGSTDPLLYLELLIPNMYLWSF